MNTLLLTDKSISPTNEIISSLIGEKYIFWEKLMTSIHGQYDEVATDWKNYRDSKCWLMPVIKKKKTLCWISLANGTTRISFWFGKKIEPQFVKSDLPDVIKEKFRIASVNKMGRGFSIELESETDLENALRVIAFKSTMK
jgi:hypothetical protein